ncbi:hypothetical protein [Shewanella algae]|uniref:hypothetical protein n=1 Tax=Shewanella algae TaxID=38313 RepID=UPI0031F55501
MDNYFNKLCLKPESSFFLAAWQRKLPPLFSGINLLKAVTFAPATIDWCIQADKTIKRYGRVKSVERNQSRQFTALHSAAEQNIDKKDVE